MKKKYQTKSLTTSNSSLQTMTGILRLTNKILVERALKYYEEGLTLKKKRRFKDAITFFSRAIDFDVQVKYLEERAQCYAEDYTTQSLAVADYSQAILIDPSDSELYHRRGVIARDMGDLNRAIELDPMNIRAYLNRGMRFRSEGSESSAVKELKTAINLCNEEIGYLGSICASDFGRLVPGISVQIVPLLGYR